MKRILAIIAIVLLVLMYALTLVAALFDDPNTLNYVAASVGATFFVPVLIWVMMLFYNNRKK